MGNIAAILLVVLGAGATAAEGPVLVFGGSGRLGAAIVKPLVESGRAVTAFVRPSSDRSLLDGLAVDFAVGDVLDADDVLKAMQAKKYAVVVNALSRRGNTEGAFYDTSQYNITAAAKVTGVAQIVFVGSLGAGESRAVYPDNRWKIYGPLLLEKERAERNIIDSGIGFTIIRNDQIVSDEVPATGTARLTEDQRARGTITRIDHGGLVAECVGAARCMNKIFHAVDTVKYVPGRPQ
jgi:uncharacterized protein YbjT (DUF2867 family)